MTDELNEEEQAILNQTADIEEPEEAPEPEEAAPAPEAPPEPAPAAAQEPQRPPENYVPHGALHAERERRKAVEAELAAMKKASESPPEAPPQLVDPVLDPEGFKKWSEFHETKTQDALTQFQERQNSAQEAADRQMRVAVAEQDFIKREPSYVEATNWAHATYFEKLRAQGFGDGEIGERLQKDMSDICRAAETIGMNPAELVYSRIKQAGWAPQQSQAPAVDETARVQALAKAQAATQGITASGAQQNGKMTLKQLAEMSEADLAKVPQDQLRQLMGG